MTELQTPTFKEVADQILRLRSTIRIVPFKKASCKIWITGAQGFIVCKLSEALTEAKDLIIDHDYNQVGGLDKHEFLGILAKISQKYPSNPAVMELCDEVARETYWNRNDLRKSAAGELGKTL